MISPSIETLAVAHTQHYRAGTPDNAVAIYSQRPTINTHALVTWHDCEVTPVPEVSIAELSQP